MELCGEGAEVVVARHRSSHQYAFGLAAWPHELHICNTTSG